MKRLIFSLAALALLWPLPSQGQPATYGTPPSCSVAELAAGTCAPARLGTRVRIRNSDTPLDADCATGTGANAIICEYDGTNWITAPDIQDGIIGGNDDVLWIANVDDTLVFQVDGTNTATFAGGDAASPANTIYDTTGAGWIQIGTPDVTAIALVTAGDATLTDQGDGNQDTHAQLIGLPKVAGWSIGASTDGSETVNTDFGDSETPATDWIAVDGDVVVSNDGAVYRKGSASLELAVAATSVEEDDGASVDLNGAGGNQDWTDDESFGMWMRCDSATSAGDWNLTIVDSVAGTTDVAVPAVTVADTWTWTEVDVSGVANASKDAITDLGLTLSAAGATAMLGVTCYFDYMWKWDAAEEETLSQSILYDGVLAAFYLDTDGANVIPGVLAEGTDFFIHYESGNDSFIAITDQSGNSVWGLAALE